MAGGEVNLRRLASPAGPRRGAPAGSLAGSPAPEPSMRLSVLDQSVATAGRPHRAAIQDSLELAALCERLGYHRFWVSEHHSHPAIVGTAPEVLLGAVAARTSRMRIGAAGIMLPHYAPFKVAEQFRVLDALAPGRVDLGLGRAPGSDGRTAFALNPLAAERPARFPTDVQDLLAWVRGRALPDGHPFARVRALPEGDTAPEVWILGSSDYGARLAALLGLPYAFAWFFTDGAGAEQALGIYRHNFRPSPEHPAPYAAICVFALAADSEETAQHHFTSRAVWRLLRDRGQLLALDAPEAAAARPLAPAEAVRLERLRADSFVGTAPRVAARLRALAGGLEVQELAIVSWTWDEAVRRRSYALLAEAFALEPLAAAPGAC
jgi:luciferase family oxidoreductase group 1